MNRSAYGYVRGHGYAPVNMRTFLFNLIPLVNPVTLPTHRASARPPPPQMTGWSHHGGGNVTVRADGRHLALRSSASTAVSSREAPVLSSGLLPLPHLGDCTQDGQPATHAHESMVADVADNQRSSWA